MAHRRSGSNTNGPPSAAAKTGRSCYARILGGCSPQLSGEHYLSEAVLKQIHPYPIVEGMPQQELASQRYSIASLKAKILCARHNSMLSPLDTEAARVFEAIDRFEQDSANAVEAGVASTVAVDGERFERWLLKVAFGLCKGKIFRAVASDAGAVELRNEELLLPVLFGLEPWPEGWGMYLALPTQPVSAPANLGFEFHLIPETNQLMMLVAWLRVVEFQLCFGKLEPACEGEYRPGAIWLHEAGSGRSVAIHLSWADGLQHETFKVERVGQREGWEER